MNKKLPLQIVSAMQFNDDVTQKQTLSYGFGFGKQGLIDEIEESEFKFDKKKHYITIIIDEKPPEGFEEMTK